MSREIGTPIDPDRLYTVSQLAASLNVSVGWVMRELIWNAENGIDFIPFGNQRLVIGEAVLSWARRNQISHAESKSYGAKVGRTMSSDGSDPMEDGASSPAESRSGVATAEKPKKRRARSRANS